MRIIKVLSIVCLLCLFVPCESIAHTHMHSHASHSAWTAPSVSMRSTSAMRTTTNVASSGCSTTNRSQGIYTAASMVRGGITTADMYSSGDSYGGPRRSGMHIDPSTMDDALGCHCQWVDNGDGTWTCANCGDTMSEDDILDGKTCSCGDGCRCPIEDGWRVWLFMAVMATGYADFVRRRRVKSEFSRKKCG